METRRFSLPAVVATAILAAVLATASQFPFIVDGTSDQYQPLHPYPSTALVDIVDNHFGSTKGRFLLYVQLRDVASGASLIAYPGARLSVEQLHGLARLREVTIREYPPALEESMIASVMERVVFTGTNRGDQPYAIAVGDNPTELVAVEHYGQLFIVDQALLGDASPVVRRG